ncbi:MAG: hypothetical protein IJP75_10120 [Bacteroidaceae bacterium]|nr:hypothetical protein [Bacteroidaceae bacterium]
MAVFAIYKIHFEQAGQKDVFGKDGVKTIDKAHEYFSTLFVGGNVKVCKTNRKGEQVPLECDVERKYGDAMALFVCNEKNVKIPKKHEELTEKAQPGCYVLVYNRADVGLIAIERSAAFDSKPDKVRDILQESFNSTLEHDYGIHLELKAKMNAEDFWDAVGKQTEFGDTVRKVVFDFPDSEKVKSVDDPDDVQKRLEMMHYLAKAFRAKKAGMHFEASKDGTLHLDRTQEDMAQMVNLCCDNGYNIAVHFRMYGVYRHGQETKAMVTLGDEMLKEFISGQTSFGTKTDRGDFSIMQWLESVRHITETYNDEEPTKKKRKRGGQK